MSSVFLARCYPSSHSGRFCLLLRSGKPLNTSFSGILPQVHSPISVLVITSLAVVVVIMSVITVTILPVSVVMVAVVTSITIVMPIISLSL